MKHSMFYRGVILVTGLCLISVGVSANNNLSLHQAEAIALANDPLVKAYQSSVSALRARAVAADTLPDPKLKLGLMNLPTDTYRRDQEPMTQVQIGIQQTFPRGDSLAIKSRRMSFMADSEAARATNQSRKIRQNIRDAWLEVLYWQQAKKVVEQNRLLFNHIVNITRSQYATGRHLQQDVVRAELELGLVDDRIIKIKTMIDQARANLSRLLGRDIAVKHIEESLPILPAVKAKESIRESIDTHPLLQMQQAMLSASDEGVALARQSYKPAWMLDLTYGAREGNNANGSPRTDFVSAMVVLDIPLFTGRRQDKYLAASQAERQVTLQTRDDRKRELVQHLDDWYSTWLHLKERLRHYRDFIDPKARENTTAALQAYQSDRGDFNSLMRAQLNELKTLLKSLRLQIDATKTQASLLYLSGESS